MGRKKHGGFIFLTYKTDHPPYHVHVWQEGRGEIGRWDIENQKPMGNLQIGNKLKKALQHLGYMLEG